MSKTVEEWRPIQGYEGLYEVSDWGNVRSLNYNKSGKVKLLKQVTEKDGYLVVCLHKNGKQKNVRVNRIVAETFIPNPQNKPYVGHLKTMENGLEDKTANEVWYLQWMSQKENSIYGTLSERKSEMMKKQYKDGVRKKVWLGKKRLEHAKKLAIPIIEIKDDGTVIEWENASEYARQIGASFPHLNNAINGKNHKRGHNYRTSMFYKKSDYEKMLEEQLLLS